MKYIVYSDFYDKDKGADNATKFRTDAFGDKASAIEKGVSLVGEIAKMLTDQALPELECVNVKNALENDAVIVLDLGKTDVRVWVQKEA